MLWMAYSPSSQTAWESVYFIQEEMNAGWLLRGIHHYAAQLMTVLLILHLMQVVIDKAYTAPREVNYWFGLGLLFLVMALSLTGYLLPWDQKGYWATKVATNMVAITPFIGESLQKIVIGGADYGHHTLTRFFAPACGCPSRAPNPTDSSPHIFVQTPRYQGEETFSESRHAILAGAGLPGSRGRTRGYGCYSRPCIVV